jgi:hypothetical protein
MAKGGARVGAGRPPKHEPRPKASVPRSGRDVSAMEHLQSVLNDPDASPSRKDRVAVSLLNVLIRQGGVSKKAVAERESQQAGWGTSWYRLLHREDSADFDPAGMPEDERRLWEAERRRKPPKPGEPRRPSVDEILAEREQRPPSADWGTDLDFKQPLPSWDQLLGSRHPREVTPKDDDDE